jgi:Apea-like HEPN
VKSEEALEATLNFILEEVARFSAMTFGELQLNLGENGLFEITDAAGHRRIMGRTAWQALKDLSETTLAASHYRRRIDLERAFRSIKTTIGKRYIRAGLEVLDGGQIARDLDDALAEAAEDCATRTHFIPCSVILPEGLEIEFGPVRLRPTKAALADLKPDLETYIQADGAKSSSDRRDHAERATTYYEAFPDLVEVTVRDCDGPTSAAIALRTAQAVLNVIHVMAGAAYTERLRIGGPALKRDVRGEITKTADNGLHLSYTVHLRSGANVGDEWWKALRDGDAGQFMQSVGIGIQAIANGEEPQILAGRFLDACAWYGDAATEPSPAAAAVKYVTAMERLLWANDDNRGVTARISERTAALCFSTATWNMDELKDEVRQAYDVRSGVVHGRLSPSDPQVRRSLRLCERLVRELLVAWVGRYGSAFAVPVELGQLREHFNGFVAQAKKACTERKSAKTP